MIKSMRHSRSFEHGVLKPDPDRDLLEPEHEKRSRSEETKKQQKEAADDTQRAGPSTTQGHR